jgi:thymidylate synthase (FAD)
MPLTDIFVHGMDVEMGECQGGVMDIARAAWVSTANHNADRTPQEGVRLLHYLARHGHWTPFGHSFIQLTFHVPIFVARQLMRHNVGIVWNEISRRYVKDDVKFFMPGSLRVGSKSIKQGSLDEVHPDNALWIKSITELCRDAWIRYTAMIDAGVCTEQARMILPVNTMTTVVGAFNLVSLKNLFDKRSHPTAQMEIRALAAEIDNQMAPPVTRVTDRIYDIHEVWAIMRHYKSCIHTAAGPVDVGG